MRAAGTRALKPDPATTHIPVIALAAHAIIEDRQRTADADCDAHLSKPAELKAAATEVARFLA